MSNSIWLPVCNKDDTRTLRHFGYGFSVLIVLLFMGVFPYVSGNAMPYWPAVVAGVMSSLALLMPKGLYYPYRTWMVVASILNAVNTRVIMFIAFFVLIAPIGLFMRLIGKAPYKRHPIKHQASYWVKRETKLDENNLKEPF